MNNMNTTLGPAMMGTLITQCGQETAASYTDFLDQKILETGVLSADITALWKTPGLTGKPYWLLGNQAGKAWLRIIEDTSCQQTTALKNTGWMSLEVSVSDVNLLADTLLDSPFKIIGPPADLDVSDQIRAMQIIGLANEVLYLTEIKGEVPPFELPRAESFVDSLFIPVLCCHDRDRCLKFYETIANNQGLSFDTKVTVINRAYGYNLQKRHPVATLQLKENTLIEIDQINEATEASPDSDNLPAGIAMLSFAVDDLDALPMCDNVSVIRRAPYNEQKAACLKGQAGEFIELIERKS